MHQLKSTGVFIKYFGRVLSREKCPQNIHLEVYVVRISLLNQEIEQCTIPERLELKAMVMVNQGQAVFIF